MGSSNHRGRALLQHQKQLKQTKLYLKKRSCICTVQTNLKQRSCLIYPDFVIKKERKLYIITVVSFQITNNQSNQPSDHDS